jgi:threonine dehydratase
MYQALKEGQPVILKDIDRFVDGAAVKKVGDITFSICKEVLGDMLLIPEGKVCTTILSLYNEDAIVVEPAGALSIAALDEYAEQIKGKNVVCVVSGSNNDIDRMQEIKEHPRKHSEELIKEIARLRAAGVNHTSEFERLHAEGGDK